jgi:uncharacterized membrane protein YqgA involved in biofilm formation
MLNAVAIVAGGVIGLATVKDLSAANQSRLKVLVAVFTVYAGLSMVWDGFAGSFGHRVAQLAIAIMALVFGKVTGRILRLQHWVNRLGQVAQQKFADAKAKRSHRMADGFVTCTLLYCLGPLAILGALQEGLLGSFRTLAVKAALDALATMAFARVFGWGVILAAIPVFAYQGSISLLGRLLERWLSEPALLESLSLVLGLLVFSIALIILELKRIAHADYLPSLAYAPLLTWLWLRFL